MAFARELRAEGFADFIHRAPADDGIRPREIDEFEDAGPRRLWRKRLVGFRAALVHHGDVAGIEDAGILRADYVERAGVRSRDPPAVGSAQSQRTEVQRT